MGTVGRAAHAALPRPARRRPSAARRPRMLGLAALDPVLVVGDARVQPRDRRVGGRRRRARTATSSWSPSTLVDGAPPLALAGGRRRGRARARARPRPAGGRRRPPPAPRRPAGAARADAALHLAQRARRALRLRRAGRRGGRPRLRLRGRLPRRRRRLGSGRRVVPRRACARGGGPWAERLRGHVGGRRVHGRPRAGRRARGDRGRGAVRRRAPRRRRDRRRRAGAGGASCSRRAGAADAVDARLVLAADQFAITTDGPPDRGRRLPVVRRMVARPDDLVRGPLPDAEPRRRGPRGAAHVGGDRLRGHARQHRRHGLARVQHRRRHALVRSTRSVGTSRSRATTDLAAELAPVLDEIIRHHVDGTRYGIGVDPADGLLRQGADGLGAHLDGRPHRRRPRDAARRQAGRGERALDPGARTSQPRSAATRRGPTGRRSPSGRARRSPRASCARTAAASSTSSTAPPGTMPASVPTSCSRSRFRTDRSAATTRPRAPRSTPAGGRS